MPIQLTTPRRVGDLDPAAPNEQYTQVKLVMFSIDIEAKKFLLRCEYGNTNGNGKWKPGILPPVHLSIENNPDTIDGAGNPVEGVKHFNVLAGKKPADTTSTIYTHAGTKLYQWLLDNAYFSGSIVA